MVETSGVVFWERELRLHVPVAGWGPSCTASTSLLLQTARPAFYSGNGDGESLLFSGETRIKGSEVKGKVYSSRGKRG